jgi:hypothetical protein
MIGEEYIGKDDSESERCGRKQLELNLQDYSAWGEP